MDTRVWYDDEKKRGAAKMEFHEKLQTLRRQRGLTQEELAAELFVSRTAISKWESGRGYPSIDSLKAISAYFKVSIDDLLSGAEVLTIAQEDQTRAGLRLRELGFGVLDCCAGLLLVLPLFTQQIDGAAHAVGVLALLRPWLRWACLAAILAQSAMGAATLALQSWEHPLWKRLRCPGSLALSTAGLLLFLLSRQPYAACFSLVLLGIKVALLLKRP